jgi:hypothetical protein
MTDSGDATRDKKVSKRHPPRVIMFTTDTRTNVSLGWGGGGRLRIRGRGTLPLSLSCRILLISEIERGQVPHLS